MPSGLSVLCAPRTDPLGCIVASLMCQNRLPIEFDKPTSGLLIIPESDFRYSLLSAITGSTRIARRAGIAVAMRTTTRRMIEPQPSVHGSEAETLYSIPARICRAPQTTGERAGAGE